MSIHFLSGKAALGLSVVASMIALAAVGCSAPPDPALSQKAHTTSDIIGGTADSGDEAVVGVFAEDAKHGSTCTGEIIAPTVVLTAGHCVTPAVLGFTPTAITVIAAPDITQFFGGKGDKSKLLKVAKATAHPQYNPQTGANDIAIVILEKPTDITPLPFNRSAAAANKLEGQSGRAIGYGQTIDGDSNSANKKNQATLKLSKFTPTSFLAASLPATQCHGDSGGPVLAKIDGKETIIGIGWRTVQDDGKCAQGVLDTRVDPYVSFIDSFLGNAGGDNGQGGQNGQDGQDGQDGADGADGADGQGGAGGDDGAQISCCVNGEAYDCPTAAACLGGFDLNACMDSCNDTACIIKCANQTSGRSPTNECKKLGACQ